VLAKRNKKSAPGPDGISYSILHKLDGCHHTLATLFNKVLVMGSPAPSWGESVVKLIHKKCDTSDPTNFRMIALTGSIGKCFHLILAARITSYLTTNKFIENTIQKAFLPGINGCIEHNIVLDEIVKDARVNKRTRHVTFFDLEDAFGSVPHSIISETLKRNHLPPNIIRYFEECYNNAKAVTETSSWRSEPYQFKRGVFQGDPLSPIIFLMAFNPIIADLKLEQGLHGYKLNDSSHVNGNEVETKQMLVTLNQVR
jgi:hypothetical protein